MKIILDGMGGDNAPAEIVKGAVEAAEEINEHIHPISDVRSSAIYRLQMASVLLKRGLLELIGEEA